MVDENEVVLLNLISDHEENESEKGADWHRNREDERHAHDRERKRLIVSKLEEPVIFVGSVSHPIQECEETFPGEVRHIQHLDAVGNEDDLH